MSSKLSERYRDLPGGEALSHYAFAEIDITDPSWVPEYVEKTTRLVEEHGGRYLARTREVVQVEGERKPPQVCLLIEWRSKEAAEAFYDSEDYRPLKESRRAGSRGDFFLVAGEDVAGVARMGQPASLLSPVQAEEFAYEWISAWNAHDLDGILAHYHEDILFTSPFALELVGAPGGTVFGLPALRAYFARGLEAYPELHFEFRSALPGPGSIAMRYRSVGNRDAIEVVELEAGGKVRRSFVHYSEPGQDS